MSDPYFVLRPEQHPPELNLVETKIAVLVRNTETQSYGVTLQHGAEGTGPPAHSHDWDECFYVLKGELVFFCDGASYTCQPGTLVHVRRGTVHGFKYGRGGGQMLEITGQSTLGENAADMFTAVHNTIPEGTHDIPKVLEVLAENRVTVVE